MFLTIYKDYPKQIPKLSQNEHKQYPTIISNPNWSQHIPKPSQNDPTIIPKKPQTYCNVTSKWSQNEPKVTLIPKSSGRLHYLCCYQKGTILDANLFLEKLLPGECLYLLGWPKACRWVPGRYGNNSGSVFPIIQYLMWHNFPNVFIHLGSVWRRMGSEC